MSVVQRLYSRLNMQSLSLNIYAPNSDTDNARMPRGERRLAAWPGLLPEALDPLRSPCGTTGLWHLPPGRPAFAAVDVPRRDDQ